MEIEKLVNIVVDDLKKVSESQPNERLPKEEQIRSCIFSILKNEFEYVCSERNYDSVENGKTEECDIWAKKSDSMPIWMEIKRCWSVSGWVNKPIEQLKSWQKDINKLSTVDVESERYFFLLGVFDIEPTTNLKVISNIQGFQTKNLSFYSKDSYTWRDSNISNISVWVWHWNAGEEITI